MTRGEKHYLSALGDTESDVSFTDEEAGVIVGTPKKATAAIAKQGGSVMVNKKPGAPAVTEKVMFLGMSVPRSYVPTFLHSKAAQIILLVLVGGAAYALLRKKGGRSLSPATNPRESRSKLESHRDRDIVAAAKFRREFHWGNPARRVVSRKLHVPPRVLAELGEVAEITYKTNKRGEKAQFFTHDFEGRRPRLGVDPKTKRLHLMGGSYTVKAAGITG